MYIYDILPKAVEKHLLRMFSKTTVRAQAIFISWETKKNMDSG